MNTGAKKYKDKYVDLKVNGRLFPTWLLANFGIKYKLPPLEIGKDDPCIRKQDAKIELHKYQLFLTQFLNYNSIYKDILIYHKVGAGKTLSAINIVNMLLSYNPNINVFVLLKATLKKDPWEPEVNKYFASVDDGEYRKAAFKFISYDSPNAGREFLEAVKNSDNAKTSLYIIEECHNFIRNVYSNLTSQTGSKRALTIYDHILQEKKENENVRVIALSGTPAINTPFELALLFNLLRPEIFPKSESQFMQEYVSTGSYKTLNPSKKNNFQRRILGLVSYYIGATPDYFAKQETPQYIDVEMSDYQSDVYGYFERIENDMFKKRRGNGGASTYSSYTRQSCNFVFPLMKQGMTGESRPRPTNFKITEKEAEALLSMKYKPDDKSNTKYYNAVGYIEAIANYVNTFKEYVNEKINEDGKNKHTLQDDVKSYHDKYKNNYDEFSKNEKKKSKTYEMLHMCSAKFLYVVFNILKSAGPVLVYSNYVSGEGLEIFKIYLKAFGFASSMDDKGGNDYYRYSEYHGGIDLKQRSKIKDDFNSYDNRYGKLSKIIMISPAGAEGIQVHNIRQVHLIEPYWHEVRMIQMIGRAIRMCSHKFLPKEERVVEIYRYKSVRKSGAWTTDQRIEDLARGKEGLLQSFLDAIKEAAIDCNLNKSHNALVEDLKCFQFDEPSLFEQHVAPAYKDDLQDDLKMNNGSNNVDSKTIRIKVLKIQAAKQLTDDNAEVMKYSKAKNYWYNPETGVVYDFELKYALGKIGYIDDLPKKLDKNTYIIDKLIPIPMIEGDD